jgi:hypothetical protein
MEKQIGSAVDRQKPELPGMYHLPVFARVEKICDPIYSPAMSEQFRPRYAVDLVVLDENDQPDTLFPLFQSVALPASCAGLERGVFGFPEPGAIVELAFAYGLPSKPFIRTILTDGLSVPNVLPGELVLQNGPEVRQHADRHGNWSRETFATITDRALNHAIESYNAVVNAHIHHVKVRQHSTEEITGVKLIEALGALKLMSGGALHIGAVGEIKMVSASNQKTKVVGDLIQRIGNIADSFAVLKQIIKVKDGGKVWLGSEGENVLKILSDLIQVVADIANTASSHTHQYTDNGTPLNTQQPNQAGTFSGQKGSADAIKGRLDPIVE